MTYIKLVPDPHELFGGVDLVRVYFFDGLLGVVHQLEELVGPCQVIKSDVILFSSYRGFTMNTLLLDTSRCSYSVLNLPFIEKSFDERKILLPKRHDELMSLQDIEIKF